MAGVAVQDVTSIAQESRRRCYGQCGYDRQDNSITAFMSSNAFGIKPKHPCAITFSPHCISIAFTRPCGLQIHHEILSLKSLSGVSVGVKTEQEFISTTPTKEPEPSTDYWIEFCGHLYETQEMVNTIACQLLDRHGIKAILVEPPREHEDGDEPGTLVALRPS